MPRRPLKVACVGEAMIEMSAISMPGSCQLGVAGDTLNTAVYLRRGLPTGHDVYFISTVGQDQLSDQMLSFMRSEGIRTDHVDRSPTHGPGLYAISTDDTGERSFQYWRSNSAARTLFQHGDSLRFDVLDQFDLVYATAISMAILPPHVRQGFLQWARAFQEHGGLFAFDSNYRPALWEDTQTARRFVEAAWNTCDVALPSLDDELALFGDADEATVLDRFRSYGGCVGAMKRGARGPVPINDTVEPDEAFATVATVVDTTAAGDSFSGGFLAAHLCGASLAEAMRTGHRFASDVIQHRGAIVPRSVHAQSQEGI